MRKYAVTWILFISLLIGEVHTFWEHSKTVSNWILFRYVPLLNQYNVKYTTDQVLFIIYICLPLLWVRNRVNITTVRTFILFNIYDTIMFFWNWKTYDYSAGYSLLIITWVLFYLYYKPVKMKIA